MASQTPVSLKIANDNVIILSGLKDFITDAFVNDATVTVTLVDSEGTEVAGGSWPLAMSYVATSEGDYRATLPYTLTGLSDDDELVGQIAADGNSLRGYWELPVIAETRTS